MSHSNLKYETLNSLLELEHESSDFGTSTSHQAPEEQRPPAYVNVVQQPQSSQPGHYISTTLESDSRIPPHVYNQREIPLTTQPQPLINTTVVTTQPKRPWKTGLCDCCSSWSVCMCVTCCPMCYACSLSRRLEENCCLACCPGGLAIMRSNVRRWHNIEGSAMDDVCVTVWCRSCVLCQMGNELNAHKYGKICCC